MGDTDHRAKFNMIVADGIEPFLYCEEYMDREANENELKQVSHATARTRMTVCAQKNSGVSARYGIKLAQCPRTVNSSLTFGWGCAHGR
jgi:hypothetical protein